MQPNESELVLSDLRRNALYWFLGAVVSAAGCTIVLTQRASLVWLCVGVIGLCVVTLMLQQKYLRIAVYVFVCGMWLINVYAFNSDNALAINAYLFSILLVIAGALLPLSANTILAVLSSLILMHGTGNMVPNMLLWSNYVVCCIASFGLRSALQAILDYEKYAVAQMQSAREHRGELARNAKALRESQESLYSANIHLQHARNAAEEARRLKAQFAANVSHELRTPINLIVGFSEVIVLAPEAYGVPLPSDYRADIYTIYRNAKHLQSLINDILDISQLEAQYLSMIKEVIDPARIIMEASAMVRELIERKGLQLHVDVPDQLPALWLDQTRIRQVILNLLANSIRFTDQGEINIRASLEKNALQVCVKDTGLGIPPSELHRVFEEFYQIESSLSRTQGGTGLGLTLSRQFVQQHGGSMGAESEGVPRKGTAFYFTLPLKEPAFTTAKQRSAGLPTTEEIRKLVVWHEDPAVTHLFKGHCHNHEVYGTQDSQELLDLVKTIQPAAVILPEGDGIQDLVALIQDVSPDISLIQCPVPSDLRQMRLHGVADYLVKPVSRQGLLNALDKLGPTVHRVLIIDDDRSLVRMFTL